LKLVVLGDGPLESVSMATVEFRPADGGSGSQLTYTEHGA
jgi:hypothetical protein